MNVLKFLGGTVLILGILFFLLDLFAAPKTYSVLRSTTINAPAEVVFPHIASLEKGQAWSPWAKKDPNMKKEYGGTDGAEGSFYTWEGNEAVGSGKQEIKRITPNKKVESKMEFYTPYEGTANAAIEIKDKDGTSEVKWKLYGNNETFIERMLTFFGVINIEKEVGPDFESGLASLKTLVEAEYSQTTAKQPVKTAN